jgi:hypothetical protein
MKNRLSAGAGKAYIDFPKEAFPTAREDYVGVHDMPHVRVLILENQTRYVVLNIEIVNVFPDTREKIVNIIKEETGVEEEHIWYHNCHVLSTPHAWKLTVGEPRDGRPAFVRTPQQQQSVEAVSAAICEAVRTAAKNANADMKPAKLGQGEAKCYGNVNRNLETEEGWWVSTNDEGPVDHKIPILRIDDEKNEPIAVLFGFHAQPAVLDMVFLEGGGRLVSADIAGYSTEFIEQEYPGCVAMYFTGAGGDGAPYFRGEYFLRGRNGRRIDKHLHEKSYLLAELLGERIGQQVLLGMERIETSNENNEIKILKEKVKLPALKKEEGPRGVPKGPVREKAFIEEGTEEVPLCAMKIGNMGLFGLLPEIGQSTAKFIEENSPFEQTMVSTFTNVGSKEEGPGKYMGESNYYDQVTFQAQNTCFAKGAAEQMADAAVELLKKLWE